MRIHVSVQTNHFFGNTNTQKTVAKEKNLRTEEKPSFVCLCIGVSGQRNHSLTLQIKTQVWSTKTNFMWHFDDIVSPIATNVPLPNAIALRPSAHFAAGIAHHCSGGAETSVLSAGGTESMMLSARAESIILSGPPAESMMLSAWGHACMLTLREYHTLRAGGTDSMMPSAHAESIILSAPPAECSRSICVSSYNCRSLTTSNKRCLKGLFYEIMSLFI
jgi:hypothetical protein